MSGICLLLPLLLIGDTQCHEENTELSGVSLSEGFLLAIVCGDPRRSRLITQRWSNSGVP